MGSKDRKMIISKRRILDWFVKSFFRPPVATHPKGTLRGRQILLFHLPDALANEIDRTLVPKCPLKILVDRFAATSVLRRNDGEL